MKAVKMKQFLKVFVILVVGLTVAGVAGSADWGYVGEKGPSHWVQISPEFSACAGRNQSPIDLVTVKMIEADLEAV